MKIDYKATIWFTIPVNSKEDLDKCLQQIKNGVLPSELYNDTTMQLGQCEPLYDTEESMMPSENAGQATIEVYSDNTLIYSNEEG